MCKNRDFDILRVSDFFPPLYRSLVRVPETLKSGMVLFAQIAPKNIILLENFVSVRCLSHEDATAKCKPARIN